MRRLDRDIISDRLAYGMITASIVLGRRRNGVMPATEQRTHPDKNRRDESVTREALRFAKLRECVRRGRAATGGQGGSPAQPAG